MLINVSNQRLPVYHPAKKPRRVAQAGFLKLTVNWLAPALD